MAKSKTCPECGQALARPYAYGTEYDKNLPPKAREPMNERRNVRGRAQRADKRLGEVGKLLSK